MLLNIVCSDHYSVCLTSPRNEAKIPTAANFDENSVIRDLIVSPLSMVYSLSDPNDAMDFWVKTVVMLNTSMHPSKPRELNRKRNPTGYQRNYKKQSISVIY